ncbi:MAG TPA: GAF domain-containing protein, partial [Roseiflexaceae bacterium]|nr:GAF domain-containing protein [Roseiflexaceae bacterium]
MLTQELAGWLILLAAILAAGVALTALRYYRARTREAQAARQRERRLNELTLAIGSSLDLTTVLREVLRAAMSLTNSNGALFGTLDDAGRLVIDPMLAFNLPVSERMALARDDSVVWTLIDSGRPFAQTHNSPQPDAIPLFATARVQAVAGVRVWTNEGIAGVLLVTSSQRRRAYSNPDIDLLQVLASQARMAIQNARLYAGMERRVRELEALRITMSELSSKLELNKLLETIVQRATELSAGDAGFVSLYDERAGDLVIQACYQFDPVLVGRRIALGQGITGQVARSHKPLVLQQADDQRAQPAIEAELGRGLMAVPMLAGNQLMGVVAVVTRAEGRSFDEDDIDLLSMFAQQATIAIQNAHSYQEEVRSATRRRLLYQVSLDIGGTLSTNELYSKIHQAVKSIVPCDTFTVVLQDAQHHRPVVVYREPAVANGDDDVPLAALVEEVLERGASVLVNDSPSEAPLFGLYTNLIVPMQLGLQVLGALVLRAPLANRYDALDLESLELLASTCAIGLRNAQLFGEVQRLAITDALTGVYNRRHFLDLAHTELARANRSPAPLAMLMIDIDQFKRINDTYGHAVGDRALQSMVHCCRATLRTIDVLGRYGGEEFAVLLSGADEQQALMVAERLRQQIAEVPIPLGDRE